MIQSVLQRGRRGVVVLGGDQHERVELLDQLCPRSRRLARVVAGGRRRGLVEQRQIEVDEIDHRQL